MRIQILELPRKTVHDEIPFGLVYSECNPEEHRAVAQHAEEIKARSGARIIIVHAGRVDLEPTPEHSPYMLGEAEQNRSWSITPEAIAQTRAELEAQLARIEGKRPKSKPYHGDEKLVEIVAELLYYQQGRRSVSHTWPTWDSQNDMIKDVWIKEAKRLLRERADGGSTEAD